MTQFIEGIDNEITLSFILVSVAAAIGVPWYFRPRNNGPRSHLNTRGDASDTTDTADAERRSQANDNLLSEDCSQCSVNQEKRNEPSNGESSASPENCNSAGSESEQAHTMRFDAPSTQAQENITIKVKFNETNKQVTISKFMQLGRLKRFCFSAEVDEGKNIRFVSNGRILQGDTLSLDFLGLTNGCIVHAQISEHRQSISSEISDHDQSDLDIGYLFVPSVTFALILGWIAIFSYKEFFSTVSVIILALLSGLFILIAYIA